MGRKRVLRASDRGWTVQCAFALVLVPMLAQISLPGGAGGINPVHATVAAILALFLLVVSFFVYRVICLRLFDHAVKVHERSPKESFYRWWGTGAKVLGGVLCAGFSIAIGVLAYVMLRA